MTGEGRRTVVVTGGSRGIGRAICIGLAGPGTDVFFNYFSPGDPDGEKAAADETERLVAEAGSPATGVSVNVVDEKSVADFVDTIVEKTGGIDVWVNNAGITKDTFLVRMKEQDWDSVIDINLKGTFNCTKLAAKQMMKKKSGNIINITSVVGVTGNSGQVNYAASKAGIIGLTKSAAKELAGRGITVNAVAPGFIETEMTAMLPEKTQEAMKAMIPMGRPGRPEDVANVVSFLASEGGSYITGQVIHISGGLYI